MATKRAEPTDDDHTDDDAEGESLLDAFNDEGNRDLAGDDQPARESRGDKKRRALQLERLGESLVALPLPKLERVPLPDDLRAAVLEAKRIAHSRGGYRRQVQFIGRIMRTLDAQPIADALEALRGEDAPSSAAFQAAERWRDRLIAEGDAALDALLVEVPALVGERTTLRQQLRQAQREKASGGPPHASRALFRTLREALLPRPSSSES